MSTRSDFTDDEWTALTDAPMEVMVAMFAAGEHGPISMVKESSAGAKAMIQPGDRGPANALIAEIIPVAKAKEARHDAGHAKGSSIAEVVEASLAKLEPGAAVVKALPADEAAGVAAWLVDLAIAVASASKGVSDLERTTAARIAAAFGADAPTI